MGKVFFFLFFFCGTNLGYTAPLPANQAFSPAVYVSDPNTLVIHWKIAPGYFLYKDRIHIENHKHDNQNLTQIGPPRFPTAAIKTDKMSHHPIAIYRNNFSVSVPVLASHQNELQVNLHFQGCSNEGFCYPPENRHIRLVFNQPLGLSSAELLANHGDNENNEEDEDALHSETVVTQQPLLPTQINDHSASPRQMFSLHSDFQQIMANSHAALTFLLFFGFGLLLAFTPCVLPMVPVLSGIILGQGDRISTGRSFLLSASYVLSMAITYAAIGAVVTFFGSNLQIMLQSTWSILALSLLFIGLAFSMFGYYELKLPNAWQGKLAGMQSKQRRGNYLGAAIMGSLSTLILSPCVTAPLVGALSYIAQTGQILFGTTALFFLGLGMGTPLLVIGTSAGKWLPKAGPWMNKVKTFFGLLLLSVAIYLMGRVLPSQIVAICWTALLAFTAMLLWRGAQQQKWQYVLASLFFIYSSFIFIETNLLGHPHESPLLAPAERIVYLSTGQKSIPSLLKAKTVTTIDDLERYLSQSKGKLIMLDFYADWCASCQLMESTTFRDPTLETALRNLVILKVDLTRNKQTKTLLNKFHVVAPPTFLFLDQKGRECKQLRLVGEHSAPQFLKHLDKFVDLTS